eukprot:10139842-Alexandrium_andersonii.AAC.1
MMDALGAIAFPQCQETFIAPPCRNTCCLVLILHQVSSRLRACVCVCVRERVRACGWAGAQACVHSFLLTSMRAYVRPCLRTRWHSHMRVLAHA